MANNIFYAAVHMLHSICSEYLIFHSKPSTDFFFIVQVQVKDFDEIKNLYEMSSMDYLKPFKNLYYRIINKVQSLRFHKYLNTQS